MKKQAIKIYASCFVASVIALSNNAKADSVCDVALTSGAFNTSDYTQNSRLVLKKRDDACKSEYNSQSEAVSAGQQSGGSIGYGGFSLGLSDAKQTGSGKWSISDSKLCKASAEELESFTSTVAKQQVADTALKAWSECLDKMNRLNLKYSLIPDGTGMTGTIVRTVGDGSGFGNITGIMSSDQKANISCRIGSKTVEINKPTTIKIDKGSTGISCNKPAATSVSISLNTDVGDTAWIVLPSLTEQKQTKIELVNDAVNQLRQQLNALAAQFEKYGHQNDKNIQHITDQIVSLSSRIDLLNAAVNAGFAWAEELPRKALNPCSADGALNCMAGANSYCLSKGGKGGFMQQWNNDRIIIVCVK